MSTLIDLIVEADDYNRYLKEIEMDEKSREIIYTVNYVDNNDKYVTAVDIVRHPGGYTAADYEADCRKYADEDWLQLFETGRVYLTWEDEEGNIHEC